MENQNTEEIILDDMLIKCYKIIDEQREAISKGRITQALKYQEQLKIYKNNLGEIDCKEVINYKREKFAELLQFKEQEIQELRKVEEKLQKELQEKYSNSDSSTEMIVYKEESFIKKILNFIKGLFKKN